MTTHIGHVTATFDKNGERGYRIKTQYIDDWFLLDEKSKPNYNPLLKNREVEFDFVVLKDKKGKEKNILIFILIEGEVKVEKIGEGKPSFSNEHQQPISQRPILPGEDHQENYTSKESREMARDFAMIRQQSIQLTLELAKINGTKYDNFEDLKADSKKFEEYIRRGE